jgi:hypothetical protein
MSRLVTKSLPAAATDRSGAGGVIGWRYRDTDSGDCESQIIRKKTDEDFGRLDHIACFHQQMNLRHLQRRSVVERWRSILSIRVSLIFGGSSFADVFRSSPQRQSETKELQIERFVKSSSHDRSEHNSALRSSQKLSLEELIDLPFTRRPIPSSIP